MTDEALRAIEARHVAVAVPGSITKVCDYCDHGEDFVEWPCDARRLVEALREAREWVQRMVRETQELRCAFCGETYPPDTAAWNDVQLVAHIEVCPKHPMREVEAERDAARAELEQLAARFGEEK